MKISQVLRHSAVRPGQGEFIEQENQNALVQNRTLLHLTPCQQTPDRLATVCRCRPRMLRFFRGETPERYQLRFPTPGCGTRDELKTSETELDPAMAQRRVRKV